MLFIYQVSYVTSYVRLYKLTAETDLGHPFYSYFDTILKLLEKLSLFY
jgi:hypothetical protein